MPYHVTASRGAILALSALAGLFASSAPVVADSATPEALVDALNGVFGKHAGKRSGHASGICVKGSFTPSADAAKLSKAAHFTGKGPFPVVGRFSMGGGNPAAPNTQKDNARGLAVHIDLGGGAVTDLVLISAPVFPAKTPDQFLSLLRTVATKDKEKIAAFFDANPDQANQRKWLNARPLPASYASVAYHSVHAFTLTNAEGAKSVVKWKLVPAGGEAGLTEEEAKGKAADFYTPELTERLAKGPAEFTLTAIIGEAGDPVDNPTALWPEEARKSATLGTLTIAALEDNATCDAGIFDPAVLADGIEGPKDDTIFQMRSPAYAVSATRRMQ